MSTETTAAKAEAFSGVEQEELDEVDEDELWELEQGIPQFADPFIQKYFDGRDALIAQEDKHRSDGDFKELLSPMAREACSIVDQIRFEEQQTIWTNDLEEKLADELKGEVYPGMMFILAKQRMESSKLWQIMRKMPKGALLHCHLEAMVDQDWLFTEALATEGMHFSSPRTMDTAEARNAAMFKFQYRPNTAKSHTTVWSADYQPDTCTSLASAAETFPEGGREGFVRWVKSRCSISPEEAISHHQGPSRIWAKFTSCFALLKGLVYYEPIYRKFLSRMFHQLVEDQVQYVDIRAAFAFDYYQAGSQTPMETGAGYTEAIKVLGEEIAEFQATEAGKSFWGARMIWTTIRAFDNRTICQNMKHLITTKQAYPHLIAGFDLVGHEDPGRSLADLTPLLFWFRKACAQSSVTLPFFFHAGETLGSGTEADHNLFDAILLGSRRIGHGFSLYKHPLLMNMVRDRRICVECCPISNEILRLTSSISSHPLPALLAHGVPVCLNNDDPAILGQDTAGMSHDFFQAVMGIGSLGLAGLGSLAENSVRFAAFEDASPKEWTEDVKAGRWGKGVRASRLKEWYKQWERFAQWVVVEFGADVDLDPEE